MCAVTYSALCHSFSADSLLPFMLLFNVCDSFYLGVNFTDLLVFGDYYDYQFFSLQTYYSRNWNRKVGEITMEHGRTCEHRMPMFSYLPRLSPALYERWSPPKSGTFLRLRIFIVASMELFHYRGTDVFRCSFHR